jgi:hypothetical protein
MSILTVPLVGIHFYPPAKQIIANVPAGTKLRLLPEPDNPYDSKAIKVMLTPADIPDFVHETLNLALDGTGVDIMDLIQGGTLQLGHVADSEGKICAKLGVPGNGDVHIAVGPDAVWEEIDAKLGFALDGSPTVKVSYQP